MKKVLVSGKKKLFTFSCWNCGCKFESDEFLTGDFATSDETYGEKVRPEKIMTDSCPECESTVIVVS